MTDYDDYEDDDWYERQQLKAEENHCQELGRRWALHPNINDPDCPCWDEGYDDESTDEDEGENDE